MTGLAWVGLGVAPVSEAQLALLMVIVVLAILAPRMIRRARGRSGARTLKEVRAAVADAERDAHVRRAADQALVDLLETSREISAQIDTKIRILNALVKEADAEARRLEALLGRGKDESLSTSAAAGGPAAAAGTEGAKEGGGGEAPVPGESRRGRRDLHERIALLQGQGRSAAEIARAMRLSLQEVNMVLHLISHAPRE